MTQNIFQKKEEDNTEVETLPTNESIEDETVETPTETAVEQPIENLDSESQPTLEQQENAGIINSEVEQPIETVEENPSEAVETDAISETGNAQPLTEEQKAVETLLTQSQVNDIVGRTRTETRDKTMGSVYERYGVKDDNELDALVGNAQKYETLNDAYLEAQNALKEATIKLAMVDSGIAPERYEDARLILQGKGLDITPETLKAESATHPEWIKQQIKQTLPQSGDEVDQIINEQSPAKKMFVKKGPTSTITALGNEPSSTPGISEKELAMNLFGIK